MPTRSAFVLTGAPGYAIDDLGRLLRLDDEVVVLDETEHDLLVAGPEGQIAVTRVDGRLTIWDRSGALHWTRPARSDTGESILAVGWSEGGHPLIAREGWSHVDGDEHVLEFERWTSWEDVERVPLPSPATCILDVGGQVHIGTAGAGVHMLGRGLVIRPFDTVPDSSHDIGLAASSSQVGLRCIESEVATSTIRIRGHGHSDRMLQGRHASCHRWTRRSSEWDIDRPFRSVRRHRAPRGRLPLGGLDGPTGARPHRG